MKTVLFTFLALTIALPAVAQYEPAQVLFAHDPALPNEKWRDVLVASSGNNVWVVRGRALQLYAAHDGGPLARKQEWPLPQLDDDGTLTVTAAGNNVWLVDRNNRRAWLFEGTAWRDPIALSDAVESATALADGTLVVNTPRHTQTAFALIGRDGNIIRRFGTREVPASSLLVQAANTWLLTTVEGNDVVAAHAYRPRMRRYRNTGELLWKRTVELPAVKRLDVQRQEVEAVIEVDPLTCCIEMKMVHFATAVMPVGSGFGVRFGLDRTIDFFDAGGVWKNSMAIAAPAATQGWLTAGLRFADGRFVAMELKRLVTYAAPQALAIAGRVTDNAGIAVSGARVAVRLDRGASGSVVTDAEGRFRITGFAPTATGRIDVTADEFLPLHVAGVFGELLARPLVIERQPEQCVIVRAAATGEPVTSFRLSVGELQRDQTSVRRSDGVTREVTRPDGRGCVRVPFAPPIYLRVAASGYATKEIELASADVTEVMLDAEVPVVVRVRAEQNPVEGARVTLLPSSARGRATLATASGVMQTSDAEGHVTLRGYGVGDYTLVVEHDEFVRWERETKIEETTGEVIVELDRGGRIDVRVVAAATGQPLADSVVHAEPRGAMVQRPLSCRTATDGTCVLGGLPDGRYVLKVEHPQHARAHETVAVGPPAHRVQASIALSDATTITGRVRGSEGYPGTRLDVLLGKPGVTPVAAPVGPDGEFSVSEAPTGAVNLWVVERDADSTLLHRRLDVPLGSTYRVDVSLPPPIRVRGRIYTAAGVGCGACTMLLESRGGEFGTPNRSAQVRGDGSYEARVPNAGSYLVTIEDRASGLRLVESIDARGDTTRDFTFGDVTLRVTARFEDGRAAEGALIAVHANGQQLVERVADASGTVRLTGLPRQTVRVTASSGGRVAAAEADLSGASERAVALTIPAHDPLRLRILDAASGLPVPRVSIRVQNAAGDSLVRRNVPTEADGTIAVPALPGAPYTIVVSAGGFALRTLHGVPPLPEPLLVMLAPGPRAFTVEVDTSVLAPCALEVRGRDGRSLALSFETPPGPVPFTTRSAMFSWLEWGTYQVLLHDCSGRTIAKQLELAATGERHVRFP